MTTANSARALPILRWADVDFAKATVHVRRNIPVHGVERVPKSGKVRSVPLADRAAEVLDALSRRNHWTSDADFVFVHVYGGPSTPATSASGSTRPASRPA